MAYSPIIYRLSLWVNAFFLIEPPYAETSIQPVSIWVTRNLAVAVLSAFGPHLPSYGPFICSHTFIQRHFLTYHGMMDRLPKHPATQQNVAKGLFNGLSSFDELVTGSSNSKCFGLDLLIYLDLIVQRALLPSGVGTRFRTFLTELSPAIRVLGRIATTPCGRYPQLCCLG